MILDNLLLVAAVMTGSLLLMEAISQLSYRSLWPRMHRTSSEEDPDFFCTLLQGTVRAVGPLRDAEHGDPPFVFRVALDPEDRVAERERPNPDIRFVLEHKVVDPGNGASTVSRTFVLVDDAFAWSWYEPAWTSTRHGRWPFRRLARRIAAWRRHRPMERWLRVHEGEAIVIWAFVEELDPATVLPNYRGEQPTRCVRLLPPPEREYSGARYAQPGIGTGTLDEQRSRIHFVLHDDLRVLSACCWITLICLGARLLFG